MAREDTQLRLVAKAGRRGVPGAGCGLHASALLHALVNPAQIATQRSLSPARGYSPARCLCAEIAAANKERNALEQKKMDLVVERKKLGNK